jgi:hypothetical protein
MKRRSFFGWTAAVAGAAAIPARAGATPAPNEKVIRTAVTVQFALQNYDPHQLQVEMPEGFIPIALAVGGNGEGCIIRVFDDGGDLIKIHSWAFAHGPIDFWRAYRGAALHCEATVLDYLSILPSPVVTIYGEIDID